jgi:hypothetical protein
MSGKIPIDYIVEVIHNHGLPGNIHKKLYEKIYSSSDIEEIQNGLIQKRISQGTSSNDTNSEQYFRIIGMLNILKREKENEPAVDKKLRKALEELYQKTNERLPHEKALINIILANNFDVEKTFQSIQMRNRSSTRGRRGNRGRRGRIRVRPGRKLTRKKHVYSSQSSKEDNTNRSYSPRPPHGIKPSDYIRIRKTIGGKRRKTKRRKRTKRRKSRKRRRTRRRKR